VHGRSVAQVDRLQEVARQCLRTLQCLHQQEVIHCDLVRRAPTQAPACSAPSPLACLAAITQKPENILISSLTDCKVKVIDYGNAYLHHDQRCSYVQSRAYRAPEVVLGLPYSPKVDMWSLGCILMELFTGKLLFDNRSVQARRLHMPAPRMLCCLLQ
jgi:serine/threonine protein kinase